MYCSYSDLSNPHKKYKLVCNASANCNIQFLFARRLESSGSIVLKDSSFWTGLLQPGTLSWRNEDGPFVLSKLGHPPSITITLNGRPPSRPIVISNLGSLLASEWPQIFRPREW